MKKIRLFFLFSFFLNLNLLSAQSVIVTENYSVAQLMERYVTNNNEASKIDGWRIQVIATTDRSKLESVKKDFMQKYPQIATDWIHAKPYYKLRAGAFSSKLEATRLLYKLKKDYPTAYPTKDNKINPSELIGL